MLLACFSLVRSQNLEAYQAEAKEPSGRWEAEAEAEVDAKAEAGRAPPAYKVFASNWAIININICPFNNNIDIIINILLILAPPPVAQWPVALASCISLARCEMRGTKVLIRILIIGETRAWHMIKMKGTLSL